MYQNWCRESGIATCKKQSAAVSRPHGVTDQRLAQGPDRARHLMTVRNRGVECAHDPVAIRIRQHKRRDELDRVAALARGLAEDLVVLEQRDCDDLTEQAFLRGFQHTPGGLELE